MLPDLKKKKCLVCLFAAEQMASIPVFCLQTCVCGEEQLKDKEGQAPGRKGGGYVHAHTCVRARACVCIHLIIIHAVQT